MFVFALVFTFTIWGIVSAESSKCSYMVYKNNKITVSGAYVNNVEYEFRGLYGRCDLFYYHFPPIFEFEKTSYLQVEPEDSYESAVVYNLTDCAQFVTHKQPCNYDATEDMPEGKGASLFINSIDKIDSLTPESCAASCALSSSCAAALFAPSIPSYKISTISSCHLFESINDAAVKSFMFNAVSGQPRVILLSNIKCSGQITTPDQCVFKMSRTKLFQSTSNLPVPPDTHYNVKTLDDCAHVCYLNPFCKQTEFVTSEHAAPECLLYREGLSNDKYLTTKFKSSNQNKTRAYNIVCGEKENRVEVHVEFIPRVLTTTTEGSDTDTNYTVGSNDVYSSGTTEPKLLSPSTSTSSMSTIMSTSTTTTTEPATTTTSTTTTSSASTTAVPTTTTTKPTVATTTKPIVVVEPKASPYELIKCNTEGNELLNPAKYNYQNGTCVCWETHPFMWRQGLLHENCDVIGGNIKIIPLKTIKTSNLLGSTNTPSYQLIRQYVYCCQGNFRTKPTSRCPGQIFDQCQSLHALGSHSGPVLFTCEIAATCHNTKQRDEPWVANKINP